MKNSNSQRIRFSKWEGIGNHFIIALADRAFLKELTKEKFRRFVSHILGVGADGMLLLDSDTSGLDPSCTVHMLNPDGTPMGMCGNGIRCVFGFYRKYVDTSAAQKLFLVENRSFKVASSENNNFSVEMGEAGVLTEMNFQVEDKLFVGFHVEVPNPHVVIP